MVLDVLQAALGEMPNSRAVLGFCTEPPLTEETLGLLSGMSEHFTPETWEQVLLPFCRRRIALMSLGGVSGDQLEQEVVNLLREALRVFYVADDRTPSVGVAHVLFKSVLEAMRHGYIETERLPVLGSTLIQRHTGPPARGEDWLREAFAPAICHNHKTSRAVFEMSWRILGLEVQGDVPDEAVPFNDRDLYCRLR